MQFAGLADPIASLSHGFGAIGFALLVPRLFKRARNAPSHYWSLGIFALSAVFLLLASATFHAVSRDLAASPVLKRIDHAAIFALIAGTFTPVHCILFTGFLRWGLVGLIWIMAVSGIVLKIVFFNIVPEWLGITLYLAMGWMGGISMLLIWRMRGPRCRYLAYGGFAYTAGAIVELIGWPAMGSGPFTSHEIFHVAVLFGLGYQWSFIQSIAGKAPIVRMRAHGQSLARNEHVNVRNASTAQFIDSAKAEQSTR